MKRFSLIPWLLAMALVWGTILLEGGNPLWFISPSAFLVCCGITFVLLLMQYSPAEMVRNFRSVAMNRQSSRQELLVAKAFFHAMQRFLLVSGLVGLGMGGVFTLAGLGKAPTEATAEGLAVSLIALVYAGFGILFVATPGESAALKKLALLDGEESIRQ